MQLAISISPGFFFRSTATACMQATPLACHFPQLHKLWEISTILHISLFPPPGWSSTRNRSLSTRLTAKSTACLKFLRSLLSILGAATPPLSSCMRRAVLLSSTHVPISTSISEYAHWRGRCRTSPNACHKLSASWDDDLPSPPSTWNAGQ